MNDLSTQRQAKTSRDWMYLLATTLPTALLILLAIWAAIDWRLNGVKLQQEIKALYGSDSISESIVQTYDQRMSRELTSKLTRITVAAEELSYEVNAASDYGEPFTPWSEYPPEEFYDEYARQGTPILAQLKSVAPELARTWQPEDYSYWSTFSFTNNSAGLLRLIQCECIDAIHKSEPERAIRALKVFSVFERSCRQQITMRSANSRRRWVEAMTAIVAATLQREELWTEQQLIEIEDVLAIPEPSSQFAADYERGWKKVTLEDAFGVTSSPHFFEERRLQNKILIGPSNGLDILATRFLDFGINTNKARASSKDLRDRKPKPSMEQILQFPFVNQNHNFIAPAHPFEHQYAQQEIARVAVAVKRFKQKMGRFPNHLSELGKINFVFSRVHSHLVDVKSPSQNSSSSQTP